MTLERQTKLGWGIFGLLAAAHLVFSLFVNVPGYLSWDAGTYHMMVKTLSETGGFVVENGYEQVPSKELAVGQLRAPAGKTVAQYPEMLTILALPFYKVMGYPGLFFLNALAFLLVNALIFKLAVLLFESRPVAFGSMAIYSFATFAWEYSQSSYPHISSTLAVLAAVFCCARVLFDGELDLKRRLLFCFGAGFAVGVAVGLRLDSLFALPALGVPLLLRRPFDVRLLAALGAGVAPPLALMAKINHLKFGSWNPVSYGHSGSGYIGNFRWYLPALILGLLGLAGLLLWQAYADQIRLKRQAWRQSRVSLPLLVTLVVVVGCAVVVLALPQLVVQIGSGLYQLIVDLRIRSQAIREPALSRTATGALVYLGGVKKSLLQSCPYLVLLYIPLISAWKGDPKRLRLLFLFLAPVTYVGVFGSLAWHGSIALNLRYLNPILPYTSILAAWCWSTLADRPKRVAPWVVSGLLLAFWMWLFGGPKDLETQEMLFLSLPLVVVALLAVLDLVSRLRPIGWARRAVPWTMLVAFAMAGALTFARDYPTSAAERTAQLRMAQFIAPHIESPALVFSQTTDLIWGLLDRVDDVYLGRPNADRFEDFGRVSHHFLSQGRHVYVIVDTRVAASFGRWMRERGLIGRPLVDLPVMSDWGEKILMKLQAAPEHRPAEAQPTATVEEPQSNR